MKFCKDCKHYEAIKIERYVSAHLCRRNPPRYEHVTGGTIHERRYCDDERNCGWLEARLNSKCGSEGRFYSPKDKEQQP